MENENIKKPTSEENLVVDTSGGEMPDADRKIDKAKDAAEAFKREKDSGDKDSEQDVLKAS